MSREQWGNQTPLFIAHSLSGEGGGSARLLPPLVKPSGKQYSECIEHSRKKPPTNMKENAGKLLLDVTKLTFGSFILGGILRGELPQYILIVAGIIVATVCAIVGLMWTSQEVTKKTREE